MASIGTTTAGAIGAALLLLALIDLFITIFNYDGFNFLSERLHHLTWRALRRTSTLLPGQLRHAYLSLGSAAMLPLTLAWWLGLEITAFALIFLPGLAGGHSPWPTAPTPGSVRRTTSAAARSAA